MNKFLARSGIASRRAAERLIAEGRVSVNGVVISRLGEKIKEGDEVCVDGQVIRPLTAYKYLALYKPRGYVTTMRDPQGRPTIVELVANIPARLYPIGRLDYDSEGLLLLTNDGDFSYRVQHPRFRIPKVYRVQVKGRLSPNEAQILRDGLPLEDGWFVPAEVAIEKVSSSDTWIRLTITEGRNRIIRRALGKIGYDVLRLIRVQIGGVSLHRLKPGHYRELTDKEKCELLA